MRIIFLILTSFYLFFGASFVCGSDPPQLNTPLNNSIVSSSGLNWQTPSYQLYSSNPYRIQVDDDPSFLPSASIYRDIRKTTTTYTPELYDGVWYWRVKAKDLSGNWSDWSNVRSFTLQSASPTPISTTSPTPSPIATPAPTTSSTASSSSISLFTFSNPPSQINSTQSFSVLVNLSLPNNPSTDFYLKGAFKKADGSNYLGLTKVSGLWVKNGSTYSSQLPITTDLSGDWSGNIEILPDSEDSGFTGSGDYTFKIGRYTASGSGPTWSNESIINITGNITTATQNTTKATSQPTTASKPSAAPQIKTAPSMITSPSKVDYQIASVAGISSSASPSSRLISNESERAKIEVKNQKQINPAIWIGSILIFAGASCLGYIYWKKR